MKRAALLLNIINKIKQMIHKPKFLSILIIILVLSACDNRQTIEKENYSIKIPENMEIPEWSASLDKDIEFLTKETKMLYGYAYDFYITVLEDNKDELDKKYTIKNFRNKKIDTLWKKNQYINSYEETVNEKLAIITEIATRDSSEKFGYDGRNYFWRIAVLESKEKFFTVLTFESAFRHGYHKNDETMEAIRSLIIKE